MPVNYATKISLVIPFVSALLECRGGSGAVPHILLVCIFSALGGLRLSAFVLGGIVCRTFRLIPDTP